jgi:hypothetical protein
MGKDKIAFMLNQEQNAKWESLWTLHLRAMCYTIRSDSTSSQIEIL